MKSWCSGCLVDGNGYVLAKYNQSGTNYCRDCIKKNPVKHTRCLECGNSVPFDPQMDLSFFQCPCHDLDVNSDYDDECDDYERDMDQDDTEK